MKPPPLPFPLPQLLISLPLQDLKKTDWKGPGKVRKMMKREEEEEEGSKSEIHLLEWTDNTCAAITQQLPEVLLRGRNQDFKKKERKKKKREERVWFKTIHYSRKGGLRERKRDRRRKKRKGAMCSMVWLTGTQGCSFSSFPPEDFDMHTLKMDGWRKGEGEQLRNFSWTADSPRHGKTRQRLVRASIYTLTLSQT